jgi:hypothetical protein
VLQSLVRGPRRLMLIWVDQMPKTVGDDNPGVEKVVISEYGDVFTDTTAKPFETKPASLGVAMRNPLCTGADDLWGIKHVTWKLKWREEGGGDDDWSTNYWDAARIKGVSDVDGTVPDMPDEKYFELTEVNPRSLPAMQKWVEFTSMRKFKIKVPDADETEPGYHVGITNGIEIGASIYVYLYHFKQGANANALNGKIRMTPKCGLGTPQGVARTLCHEIAHNLGHAYLQNQGKATDGRGRQAKYKIPDIDFDPCIPTGIYYAGKGHAGPHCASGIKKKDPKLLDEKTFTADQYQLDTNCILFGQGDQAKTTEFKFCDDCTRYILASDALDISTNWRS